MIQIIWLVQCIDWIGNMMTRVAMHVAVASLTQIQIESSESLRDMSYVETPEPVRHRWIEQWLEQFV